MCRPVAIRSAALSPNLAGKLNNPSFRSNSRSCNAYTRSNPATHSPTADPSTIGIQESKLPVTANQAPTGAVPNANPKNPCEAQVKRLVSE